MLSAFILSAAITQGDLAVFALLAADAAQTVQISVQPDRYWETNPILPAHPSKHQVYQHFVAAATAYYTVAENLPQAARDWWTAAWVVGEGYTVASNWRLGLKVDFK